MTWLCDEDLEQLEQAAARCELQSHSADVLALIAEVRAEREMLQGVCDEIDQAIAAHDAADPRHPSHGQHHNGPCCVLGNLNPSAIRGLRDWRDVLDRVIGGAS